MLRSYTGYGVDELALMRPDIYSAIETEGRSKETVRGILQTAFNTIMDADNLAAHMYATDNIVLDIKNFNFGQNEDLTYGRCTRGITPLACLPVTEE